MAIVGKRHEPSSSKEEASLLLLLLLLSPRPRERRLRCATRRAEAEDERGAASSFALSRARSCGGERESGERDERKEEQEW